MASSLLRVRGQHDRVTPFELFFDLVYVFAVTQLSHLLLEQLTVRGIAETMLLLLAVWWAWMYTSWTTNWFDPGHPAIRVMLAGVMLASLVMSATLPGAFGDRGLWFAGAYVVIQLGRTLFVVAATWRSDLGLNFRRILFWIAAAAVFWIAGGFAHGSIRIGLWLVAVAVEYSAPWTGYATPGLGRSRTRDWTIAGDHMAERCRLFIMIALGESLLVTGATFGDRDPTAGTVAAMATAFLGTLALWWIYFDRSADAAAEAIAASDDPGRLGRSAYTFLHLPMAAGIIISAVADELIITHPGGHTTFGTAVVILGGPALFLAGHLLFTRVVFGRWSRQRMAAVGVLVVLLPVSAAITPLTLGAAATLIVVTVAIWDLGAQRAVRPVTA
jgi:low temperature requirement protein LtrA